MKVRHFMALTLLAASPISAQDEPPFDVEKVERYIAGCQADAERRQAKREEAAKRGVMPIVVDEDDFYRSLPAEEQPLARALCVAWLDGMLWQLAQTPLHGARAVECRPGEADCHQWDDGKWYQIFVVPGY